MPRLPIALIPLCLSTLFFSCDINGRRPSDPPPGLHVPDGYTIERAAPPGMLSHPYFATLDLDGRLFVVESSGKTTSTEDMLKNPTFMISLLEDLDHDGVFDQRKVFADKITYPMGSYFYDGSLYVTAPPDLLRFTDTNADGVADKREVVLTGWTFFHNGATLSGPFFGPDGWMYMCDARRGFDIQTKEGTRLKGKGARIWRCRPNGSGLESVSGGGFDNSVELTFMPTGETIGTMTYFTDPQNGFRDALMHWVEGGVYPKPFPVIGQDSLTLTGDLMPVMTKLPRVAPAGLMRYRGTTFGDDFDGNLFSAEFNTGRIMRHRLSADGATYQTTDEVFMRSDSLDSHPTDVLEDADGSLLVVTTGGWFIAGCPLSVVAKADIEGGLFRIRKKDVSEVTDARGQGINFKSASATALTDLLSDTRPFVKDKAIEELVLRGNASVAALNQVLDSSDNQEARASAVFALYRIQTGDAMRAVSSALDDKSLLVRTAAARAVGLARDTSAVDKLITMVEHDSPPVRRQGATALGQIGDTGAVKALVAASATARDRFVEHAIRYALITLGKSEPLLAALKDPSERVRQTALVALDQMDGSPLVKGHVVPFLQSEDPAMQKTGVWVLSHHADWSDVAVAYLKRKLRMHAASDDAMVSDLMVRFMSDPSLQNFVIDAMRNAATPAETRLFLLNVVAKGAGHDLPERWLKLLEHLLRQGDDEMRLAVLDMLQSRSIRGLESQLVEMSADARLTIPVRLKALGAHIASHPELSGQSFGFLMQCMRPENDPPARQAAVRLLAQAKLNDRQLLVVANDLLANADAFILPGLVNCFEGNSNEAVGEAFVDALSASSSGLGNLSAEDLQAIISGFSPAVRSSAAPLLKALAEQQASRLSELRNLQAGLKGGDVREGRKLFYSKAMCYTCHSVTGEGGTFGPDLTNIGEIRSEHDILEAILYPSASFAREYEPSKVSTTTANYSGIIKQEIGDVIVMETGPGTSVRIPRKDVLAIEPGNVSMMPPGLNKQLTQAELTDLIAYLTTLPDGMGRLKRL